MFAATMDFRQVAVGELDWSGRVRGQPAARARGDKVVIQTPVAACKVSLAGAGMYRMDIALRPDVSVHSELATWLCEVDETMATCADLAEWRQGKTRSDTLFRNNWRLMAFSDTLCFDAQGKLSFDLLDAASCSCLVELQGGWSSDTRWGVRWKVLQVKFSTEPADCLPAAPAQHRPAFEPRLSQFAFMED